MEAKKCPGCGVVVSIFEDSQSAVGADLAGFYVSHPYWVEYPVATTCPGRDVAGDLPKTSTRDDCILQWNGLVDRIGQGTDAESARIRMADIDEETRIRQDPHWDRREKGVTDRIIEAVGAMIGLHDSKQFMVVFSGPENTEASPRADGDGTSFKPVYDLLHRKPANDGLAALAAETRALGLRDSYTSAADHLAIDVRGGASNRPSSTNN